MLILARHGRTPQNAQGRLLGRDDPALDDVGQAQAAAIARAVPKGSRVISSPLRRCRETASAITDDVEIDDRLIEMAYGEFEGRPVREVPATTWAQWRADPSWAPPGGESHDDLAARVWSALDDLASASVEADIVLVSHVSPIKAAIAWALGVPIDIAWRCFVEQASLTRVAAAGPMGAPSLRTFNETAHLDGIVG